MDSFAQKKNMLAKFEYFLLLLFWHQVKTERRKQIVAMPNQCENRTQTEHKILARIGVNIVV